ncbi:MAG: TIGR02221 family CRISPR-associated protein [Desulfosoma sp.]
MARVFISPLGTNKYLPCYYEIDGRRSARPVNFIQEALLAHWCVSWTAEDRILILCTREAEERNWLNGGNFEKGLRTRIEELNLPAQRQMLPIPDGKNETEIMDIFMILMEALKPQDQVYLDVTHSFRSLPLLQTVILNYAKVLKDIRVERIVYGAFETMGTLKEVEQRPVEQRIAPVFDLTPYDALLDWARAVDIFQKAGRPQEIKRLIGRNLGAVFNKRQEQDQKKLACSMSTLGNQLENLCLNLSAARGPHVLKAQSFDEQLDAVENQRLIPPLTPLLEILRRKVQRFKVQNETTKGFEAAAWCLEHELIPQAYVLLRETILSALCRWAGQDPMNEKMRENFWSALLHVVATGKPEKDWEGLLAQKRDEALHVLRTGGEALKTLAKKFEALRDRRNDLMHAGWKTDAKSAPSLLQFLQNGGLESLRTAWEAFEAAVPPLSRGHGKGQ